MQHRTRLVEVPEANGGQPCGPVVEDRACRTEPCAVDCVVGPWSDRVTAGAVGGFDLLACSLRRQDGGAHGLVPGLRDLENHFTLPVGVTRVSARSNVHAVIEDHDARVVDDVPQLAVVAAAHLHLRPARPLEEQSVAVPGGEGGGTTLPEARVTREHKGARAGVLQVYVHGGGSHAPPPVVAFL
jgi:hypothetical protein